MEFTRVTKDFDPGQDEYLLTDPGLFGFSGFIQKIDLDGNLICAKSMGVSECSRTHHVALDTDGNIFVYGEFKDSVDADPGIGEFRLYSPNINSQLFILKLDSEGDFVWAKSLDGAATDTRSMKLDLSGDIVFTGTFTDSIDCDPGPGEFYLGLDVPDEVYTRRFVAKWSNDGELIWAKLLAYTPAFELSYDCSDLDNLGNIYLVGFFFGSHDFDPGVGAYELVSTGGFAGFIQKLDADGNFISAQMLRGDTDGEFSYNSIINTIDVESPDNITIGGEFIGNLNG